MNQTKQSGNGIINFESLSQQAFRFLRNEIIEDRLHFGERLTEERLAEDLGVSRVVVRDTLMMLEVEGLIVKERKKGNSVVEFNHKDIEDLFNVRVALEICAATGILREKKEVHPILNDQINDLHRILEGDPPNLMEFVEKDLKFHRTIIKKSGNARLITIWSGIESPILALMYRFMSSRSKEYLTDVTKIDHNKISDAFQSNDLGKIRDVLALHIYDYIDNLKAMVSQ
jgi:DNA-binding GntR family transcriptional regulator